MVTTGRRPTHELRVKRRDSEDRGVVGVAWQNDNGTFSIKLRPCVVISSNDDVTILLVKIEGRSPARPAAPGQRQPSQLARFDVEDDGFNPMEDDRDDFPFG